MGKRHLLGGLAVTLALAAIPACKDKGTTPKANEPFVAFVSNNAHEFWTIARRGTEAAAKEFGVRVEFRSPPNGTANEQRQIIEDLLAKGVKAIAVSPNDSANQIGFFKEVNAKVPLVAVDNDLPDAAARRCYIGTDNVAAGRAVGKLLKEAMPQGGPIMIFVGKLDAQNAVERRAGVVVELAGGVDKCKSEIEQLNKSAYPIKFGDFTLLDTRTDDVKEDVCRQKTEDALLKYPDLKGMAGLWAYNPPAMLLALKGTPGRLGKVALIAFDENEETLQGIKDGHIPATVVQDPYNFGYESVKVMASFVKGTGEADLKARTDRNDDNQIYIRHRIINKDGKAGPKTGDEKFEPVEAFHAKLKELKGTK
jgi:ribose transport system substrate-binding protein